MSSIGASRSFPSRNSISSASNNNGNGNNNNRSFQPSTPPRTSTIDQSSILNSIQRRISEGYEGRTEDAALIRDLEKDLKLSATLGISLVEEKQKLEKQKLSLEAANNILLDRITLSVKENAQLQRRLEQAVGNLEQADGNNRALLVSLEEDRKTISRLSIDSARLSSTSVQLKSTTQALEDVKQELLSEQKRAEKAEYRMKKHEERVVEMEEILTTAREDVESMRQDKVLRSKNSRDVLAKVKARFSTSIKGFGHIGENSEAAELLKVIESLVSENDSLKSASAELYELLDVSRDAQSELRLEMEQKQSNVEIEEINFVDQTKREFRHSRSNTPLNLRAELLSPSISQSSELHISPTSTNPTSYAPHSPNSRSSKTDVSRTFSNNSFENENEVSQQHLFDDSTIQAVPQRRRATPNPALEVPINGGTVPFGRGHGRRTVSVDVASFNLRNNHGNGQTSPYLSQGSPPSRPVSIIDNNNDVDEISLIKKHRPRPLSLSLGPSLFPAKGTEDRVPSPRLFPETIPPAYKVLSPPIESKRSPTKRPRNSFSSHSPTRIAISIDCSTQTSPIHSIAPSTSIPRAQSSRNDSADPFTDLQSITSASDLSDRDKEFTTSLGIGATESRTAALGTLIEYTAKLLARIQSADIASQENRLKKQNLPGDVRHLAQANLKDLLADIEGLRAHFRRLLEQERAAAARDGSFGTSESLTESLVVRKDFVALVKLFRDLLFETSRLRSLVNRIELEPNLATHLRELDLLNVLDIERSSQTSAASLLAPLTRIVGNLLGEPQKQQQQLHHQSKPVARSSTKLTGSSEVTSATVEVEFGKGASKQAVKVGTSSILPPTLSKSTSSRDSTMSKSTSATKSGSQVKRELNSIFAGKTKATAAEPWVVLPSKSTPTSNPFGRLLSNYRPAKSSTTYAVLDSIPHLPPPDHGPQPTLLERQLRPRGLSDSSIRSTFIAHANPHHRIVSPATLALSSEVTINNSTDVQSIMSKANNRSPGELKKDLNSLSSAQIISRKQSTNRLRSKPSQMQIRSVSNSSAKSNEVIPPLPTTIISTSPLPISISISPSRTLQNPNIKLDETDSGVQSTVGSVMTGVTGVGSLFNNFSAWATSSSGSQIKPSTLGGQNAEEERERKKPIDTLSNTERVVGSRVERGRESR